MGVEDDKPTLDLTTLLTGTALTHLTDTLAAENLCKWADLSRLELLARLKDLGVTRLIERQALANAFAKYQRGEKPDWKAPPSVTGSTSPPLSTRSPPAWKPPPPPPPPRGTPIFDAQVMPDEYKQANVRKQILRAESGYEVRNGLVKLKLYTDPTLVEYADDFGECSDSSCGCYRLKEPRVRSRFRNLAVARTAAQLKDQETPNSVRYVSLGCGKLLTDIEILCGLREKGLTIQHIALVDSEYRRSSEWCKNLFNRVATLFAPARVVAFDSLSDLRKAAELDPITHGRMTTVMQIDNTISDIQSQGLAARLLVPGGLYLRLRNDGRWGAPTECMRRLHDGLEADRREELFPGSPSLEPPTRSAAFGDNTQPLRPEQPDPLWAKRLEKVSLEPSEDAGWYTDPLGRREDPESIARPLYDGVENEKSRYGSQSNWHARQKNKSAEQTASELSAALNLL